MRKLQVIGIGTGNPDQLTLQAVEALRRSDAVFALDKGEDKSDLLALRREICERFLTERPYRWVTAEDVTRRGEISGYDDRVSVWHAERAGIYADLLCSALAEGETGTFLVWGDPSLYDSTLRILERVRAGGRVKFDLEVIPGISSVQALAASHQLVLNSIGGEVRITTGRRLREGWPEGASDVIVMLDSGCSFKSLDVACDIYWGAYLGSSDELLCSGPIDEVADRIEALRSEARRRKGWILDIYLLRRRDTQGEVSA